MHIQYSYDDRSVVVVNSLYREIKNLRAKASVYSFDLEEKFSKDATLDVPSDGVVASPCHSRISGSDDHLLCAAWPSMMPRERTEHEFLLALD